MMTMNRDDQCTNTDSRYFLNCQEVYLHSYFNILDITTADPNKMSHKLNVFFATLWFLSCV